LRLSFYLTVLVNDRYAGMFLSNIS
jgi:hypothetical protein